MPMQAVDIEALIVKAFPDAKVEIRDLAGDGDRRNRTGSYPAAKVYRVRDRRGKWKSGRSQVGEKTKPAMQAIQPVDGIREEKKTEAGIGPFGPA